MKKGSPVWEERLETKSRKMSGNSTLFSTPQRINIFHLYKNIW